MDRIAFGNRLKSVRKERRITSTALAGKSNMNAVYIRQIETAARLPSLSTFVILCNVLEVCPYILLADSLTGERKTDIFPLCNKIHHLTERQIEETMAYINNISEDRHT